MIVTSQFINVEKYTSCNIAFSRLYLHSHVICMKLICMELPDDTGGKMLHDRE